MKNFDPEKIEYRNIHTGKVVEIISTEEVSNPPIEIFILSNGEKWDKVQFRDHFKLISIEGKEDIDIHFKEGE